MLTRSNKFQKVTVSGNLRSNSSFIPRLDLLSDDVLNLILMLTGLHDIVNVASVSTRFRRVLFPASIILCDLRQLKSLIRQTHRLLSGNYAMHNVKLLNLVDCDIEKFSLSSNIQLGRFFSILTQLRSLYLMTSLDRELHVPHLSASLNSLILSFESDTPNLNWLTDLQEQLVHLKLTYITPQINGIERLQPLASLTHLQVLDLGGCYELTDADLHWLNKLSVLDDLSLFCCRSLTGAVLSCLPTTLTSLNIGYCVSMTVAHFAHLRKLTRLATLVLAGQSCDINEVMHKLHMVTHDSNGSSSSDGSSAELSQSLTSLDLSHCVLLTDSGLDCLSRLVNLQALNLSLCSAVTEIGVVRLLGINSLHAPMIKSLLNTTGNSDDTFKPDPPTMSYQLAHLKWLDLSFGVRLTAAGIAAIKSRQLAYVDMDGH